MSFHNLYTKLSITTKQLVLAIISGLLCNLIWLLEIKIVKGWQGLNWLNGYMHSVFLIIPITALSYIISIRFAKKISVWHIIIAMVSLSTISMLSFELARDSLYMIHSRFIGLSDIRLVLIYAFLIGALLPNLIFCAGFYYITNNFLAKTTKKVIFLFLSAIVMSVILGLFTVNIAPGYGTGSSFIDSVKMGYPIFWLNILLGISAIIITKTSIGPKLP